MSGHHGSCRRYLAAFGRTALVLALAVVPIARVSAADEPRRTVIVRVYQNADLPFATERALIEAETALRGAGVDVRWRRCAGPLSPDACRMPPESAELLLRITLARRDTRPQPRKLGEAILSRCDGSGVFASVYADRIIALARDADVDGALLLGRVAAHELGHLLKHTSAHARSGLMRSNWTPEEVRRDRPVDWMFTAEDLAAMRR